MKNDQTLERLQTTLARLQRERNHYAALIEAETGDDPFFSARNVVRGTEMMIFAAERLIEKEREGGSPE